MLTTMKALRTEKKISQEEIADALGISQPMVSYIENGNVPCPEEHKPYLRDLFQVKVAEDLFIPYVEYLKKVEK